MKYILIAFIICLHFTAGAQTIPSKVSKWIWYPGDFEIWLHTKVSSKRQERGQPYPPFWRVDSPYGLIKFEKNYDIKEADTISVFAQGTFNLRIDNQLVYNLDPSKIVIPSGKHNLQILIENYKMFPSLLVKGDKVNSDEQWIVTNQNQKYYQAASGKFTDPLDPPHQFQLSYKPIDGKIIKQDSNTMLIDFGKETFGKIIIRKLSGIGKLNLYYGETKEEALAERLAETYDELKINSPQPQNDTTAARAFRYVYVVKQEGINFEKIDGLYEYLPLEKKGSFSSSDSLLNKIYDVSLYTLELNTREFHIDGIKRDHWIWSGDAYQSYLMNFYSFFDEDVNKRTIYALRGHDPVETHVNTILDYSFYWIIGIADHFQYTGDSTFLKQVYPRMKSMMEFCLSRTNKNGFVEGLPGDWVFVDWAEMDKSGELSFEQLLLARSLETMAITARVVNDLQNAEKYEKLAAHLKQQVFDVFWNKEKKAFMHTRKDGKVMDAVTRYTNMFSILFNYVNPETKQLIKENVILNEKIQSITTPYMKFYELAALCEVGETGKAIEFVRDYWGGMLKLGATSIWETYDPNQSGAAHYEMYGRPFGKSLCHAWGANPVYLFGKYLLGVQPTSPGYQTYAITPSLAGLKWIEGNVPTPNGNISVYMNQKEIKVKTASGVGILKLNSKKIPVVQKGVKVKKVGATSYEVELSNTQSEYVIRYF